MLAMGRRRRGSRVLGPYCSGTGRTRRWHVVEVAADGARTRRGFAERAHADLYADELRDALVSTDLTVSQAVEHYLEHLAARGNRASSLARTRWALTTLHPEGEALLDTVTARRCGQWYHDVAARLASASQRGALAEAKTFGRWLVARAWLASSPWDRVVPTGPPRAVGKQRLTRDEARAWLRVALQRAATETGAVAATVALLCGLRAGEIVALTVRDLDDDGRLLRVERGKTTAARRVVSVPDVLRPHLVRLAAGRAAGELLWGAPHWRDWPREWTQRICREAGVTVVTAHGLRGTLAELAVEAGLVSGVVADYLGHEDARTTETAYAGVGAVERATRRRGLEVLDGGKRRRRR